MTENESSLVSNDDSGTDNYVPHNPDIAQTFSLAELSALIRDLNLPKISAELLGLGLLLNFKNLRAPSMSCFWYRNH